MEPAEVSVLLDALTGGTAERFGEVLAAPNQSPDYAPFEMPLLAAHQPPADPLSPSPFLPGGFELGPMPVEYTLPVSAVTGVSGVSSRSEGIRKKRGRGSPVKAKKEMVLAVNTTVESDVSTMSPKVEAKVEAKVAPKSHTRKCREKVTRQFEHLLEVLPRPSKGVEVKHKAQILEYTIKIFRYLLLRRTSLQTEIALASKAAMREWMRGVGGGVNNVLEGFVGLYCVKKSWRYGELWTLGEGVSLNSCLFNTDDEGVLSRLDRFATVSRARYSNLKIVEGMIGRVITTKQPERLDDLGANERTFERAQLAEELGLVVAEAVPIVADDAVRAVLLFGDVERHKFHMSEMMTLMQYCEVLAELYGKEAYGKSFLESEFV